MLQRVLIAAVVAVMCLVFAGAAAAAPSPDRLELPSGWQPEGIAAGKGKDLFVGSLATGQIIRFDARTGYEHVVVSEPAGAPAVGLKVDNRNRLFVAGGGSGKGFVYDARTGRTLKTFTFAQGRPTFVNDVTLTNTQAFFTDSQRNALYVVDTRALTFRELPLPDIPLVPGFNLNGIAASTDGKTLLAVQTAARTLWRIDARTGDAERVDLGGYDLVNGDGLLLEGRRLYVVQNRSNQIAEFRLDGDLRSGRLVEIITAAPGEFDVPTTVARLGNRLYAANARFGTTPTPTTKYWVTQVRR